MTTHFINSNTTIDAHNDGFTIAMRTGRDDHDARDHGYETDNEITAFQHGMEAALRQAA